MTDPRHYYLRPWTWRTPVSREPYWSAPDGTLGAVDLRPPGQAGGFGFFATAARLDDETDCLYLGGGHLSTLQMSQALVDEWRARLQITEGIAPTTLLNLLWLTLTVYSDPDGDGRALPLLPTHEGRLELHLGGHSLVRSAPWEGTRTPHWGKVQRVLQRESKAVKQASKAVHGKWLQAMADKFKVDFREIDPDGKPEKPTTTISESFNKADSATLGPLISWTEIAGSFDVVSNRASARTKLAVNIARADSDLSSADMYAQAQLMACTQTQYGSNGGPAARIQTANSTTQTLYCYLIERLTGSADNTFLGKFVAGAYTNFGGIGCTWASGDLLKITCNGSTLKGYQNGVERRSVTDTAITGNLRAGLFAYFTTTSGDSALDAFEAGDLLAAPTFKPYYAIPRSWGFGLR